MSARGALAGVVAIAAIVAATLVVALQMSDVPQAPSVVDLPARNASEPAHVVDPTGGRATAARSDAALAEPVVASAADERAAEPRAGLVLRGRVVDGDRVALSDAALEIVRATTVDAQGAHAEIGTVEEPFARATSARDGAFEIALEPPVGARVVSAEIACRRRGFGPFARALAIDTGSGVVELGDVVLRRGTTLRGTVRDRDGAPVRDADVTAIVAAANERDTSVRPPPIRARSAAGGAFEIDDAPHGRVELRARLDDGRWSLDPVAIDVAAGDVREGLELVVPLYADPTAILGVVLGVDGAPLAGAPVSVSYRDPDGGGGSGAVRLTDERGRFRVQGREGRVFRITAADPLGRAVDAHADDVEMGRHDLVLRLALPRAVRLIVHGARGEPVERYAYEVHVQDGFVIRTRSTGPESARVGGEAELTMPGAPFTIALTAPGYASAEVGPFDPTRVADVLSAELQPLPALRGRVVRRGTPVAGAVVSAHAALEPGRALSSDGFRLVTRPEGPTGQAKTGADGTFVLHTGAAGDWWISVAPTDRAFVGPYSVASDRTPPEIEIDLGRRGSIEGRVRTLRGEPVASASVVVSCGDGGSSWTSSDARGEFRFPALAPGPWQVHLGDAHARPSDTHYVRHADVPPIVWDVRVEDGRVARFDLVAPDPATLVVRVTATAPALAKTTWSAGAARTNPSAAEAPSESRAGDGPGERVLELPYAGRWALYASGSAGGLQVGFTRESDVPAGSSEWTLALDAGSVRGRLRAPFAPDARVRLGGQLSDGSRLSATNGVAADGSFEFPFACTGQFGLSVDGDKTRRAVVEVIAGRDVDAGEL